MSVCMRMRLMSMVVVVAVLGLSACSSPKAPPPTPLDALVASFERDRSAAWTAYGLATIKDVNQAILATDCMVFEHAAKTQPTTLGAWAAWADSMYYRAILGCAEDVPSLVQAEEGRRGLRVVWEQEVAKLPYPLQAGARESRMGQLVASSVDRFITEETVCQTAKARDARFRRLGHASIRNIRTKCDSSGVFDFKRSCTEAWSLVAAHQQARGARDDRSITAELLSRYRMAFFVCSPNAAAEYVQFHAQVPPRIFEGDAYRLRVAIDPILACSIQAISTKQQERRHYVPGQEYVNCAQKWGYQGMYITDAIPNRFSRQVYDDGAWLFNPTLAQTQSGKWTLGACETELIGTMAAQGLNAMSPEALVGHCKRVARRRPGS